MLLRQRNCVSSQSRCFTERIVVVPKRVEISVKPQNGRVEKCVATLSHLGVSLIIIVYGFSVATSEPCGSGVCLAIEPRRKRNFAKAPFLFVQR